MQRKNCRKGAKFCRGGAGFAGRILRGKCAWIFAEDSAGVLRGFCAERECGASQGKSKLAPPESSIPGCHRLASAPLLRRQIQACHICAAREKQIGRIQRSFWPLSRNDSLKLRRQPGKKQVGAAGKFNSGVPQACLGAAAAAPNPGMPYLRRKREAKWPDSEKLLGNFWPLSRNDFLKLRRQPGKSKLAPMGSSVPGRYRLAPPPHQRPQTCSLLAPCRFCMIQFYL